MCPPPLARLSESNDEFEDEFEGAPDKHAQLALHLPLVAEMRSVSFFDAGTVVSSSDVDGIHLDEPAHAILGTALAQRVRELYSGISALLAADPSPSPSSRCGSEPTTRTVTGMSAQSTSPWS